MANIAEATINQDQSQQSDQSKKLTGSLFKRDSGDAPFIIKKSSFFAFQTTLFKKLDELNDIRDKIENIERARAIEQAEADKEAKKITPDGTPVQDGKEEDKEGLISKILNGLLSLVKTISSLILGLVNKFLGILKSLFLSKFLKIGIRLLITALIGLIKHPVVLAAIALAGGVTALMKLLDKRIEEAGGEEELTKEAEERAAEAGTNVTPLTPETAPEPTGRSTRQLAASRWKESQNQLQSDKMVIGNKPPANQPPPQPQPANGTPTPTPEPSAAPTPAPGAPQKEDFTMKEEGFSPNLYKDAGGYSIGYGHHLTPTELASKKIILNDGTEIDVNKGITKDQAKKLYDQDKQGHTKGAIEQLKKLGVDTSKLNPETMNALSDLAYNAGPGIFNKAPRLVAALKENNLEKIAAELKTTATTSEGKQLAALKSRAEKRANMVLASAAPPSDQTTQIAQAGDISPEARAARGGQIYIQPIVVRHELKAA